MRIDIFSDPICPWCYIGKRRIEQALASYHNPLDDLKIVWRAFQLNPDMPEEGMDRQTYLTNKFGGEDRARQIYQNIKQVGETVGLDFQFDAIGHTPSTIKSHRLIRLAHGLDKQDDFTEELFKAYFLEGKNIGDNEVLLKIATDARMDGDSTMSFL
ncbi:DsbA family oxidoreductase, partial [Alphaproteobacteria bacterium]|nr:DsbA family oxidoreductase [Alphaproteobacteria bacterium]